jgi:indole-3-glycerol phosphate synthase/phosphoribosylanthranilate isomerase
VSRSRAALAERKARAPQSARSAEHGSVRAFQAAIAEPGRRFIFECKLASPSSGRIRPPEDIFQIAAGYDGIADVLSVLTEPNYFGGSLEDIARVRRVTKAPVLRKDFTLDPYDVEEAWAHGADAVLLMLSVLDDETYRACRATATRLGLGTITEVHDEAELARASALEAPVIGVNNRDLRTLRVDLATTERLSRHAPSTCLLVSESGIGTHDDVRRLSAHANAFLVGTSLTKQPRADLAARELAFGAVKVCGLCRPEDASVAYRAGAVYGGLIFAPGSPRCIDAARARELVRSAPLRFVGVFTTTEPAEILAVAREVPLDVIQLHAPARKAAVAELRRELPHLEIWCAESVDEPSTEDASADRILFDSRSPIPPGGCTPPGAEGARQFGGTGTTFDWSLLPDIPRSRMVLAGGINPSNVCAARATGAAVLDVSSGVEARPGVKAPELVHALFENLRRGSAVPSRARSKAQET